MGKTRKKLVRSIELWLIYGKQQSSHLKLSMPGAGLDIEK